MKRFLIVLTMATLMNLPVLAQHGGGHSSAAPGASPAGPPANPGMSDMHGNSGNDMRGNTTTKSANSASNSSTGSAKTPGELLTQNTKLSEKLQGLLPAGTDMQQAASGFKNLGQFVAAVHVSHNLGISFDDLKAKMTGDNAESLGKAIGELKPSADSKAEASKANKQAKQDIKGSQG